ncbi:hypothetical protein [Roseofilum capinflatum]|uniref:Uncharacterized protein n=1 Tax=Roseofilum capinflatum BLCC-M114 TaxID=3022440 RepID=A0ABT7B9R3_9CYAN|nr:hypothetical protein [Roseofilum capinflatum]MDJ1175339.1 hypothetical protein [Roseofilum capinflatum BLCC-M114]
MVLHQHPLRKFAIYQQSSRKKRYISVVAYFDRHGILNDYVVLDKSLKVDWTRVIFQTISLKLLMGSFLSLEGFTKVTIKGKGFKSVIIPTNTGYRAMIYEQSEDVDEKTTDMDSESTLPLVHAN